MNERNYDNQSVIAYLLGSLPEAEAERFDELSFTDDRFADALKAAESDLIDAYVQEELTGESLEKFKSHYLASPLRRKKVEFAKAFQVFAERDVAETGEEKLADAAVAVESKPERTAAGFFSALNVFSKRPLQWGFAAAALLLLVLGGSWIVSNRLGKPEGETVRQNAPTSPPPTNQTLSPVEKKSSANSSSEAELATANKQNNSPASKANESPQKETEKETAKKQPVVEPKETPKRERTATPPVVASFILAPPLRGSGSRIQNISIPKQADYVAMRLQLESDDYPAYRVALVNQADETVWRAGALKAQGAGENKSLPLRFPAKLLKSQVYSLTVSGVKADGTVEIISSYPFKIVR